MTSILYEKKIWRKDKEEVNQEEDDEDEEAEDEGGEDEEAEDGEAEDDGTPASPSLTLQEDEELSEELANIKKVRKIGKTFRESPVENEALRRIC